MTTGYLIHKCTVNVPSTIWFDFISFLTRHDLHWNCEEIIEVENKDAS